MPAAPFLGSSDDDPAGWVRQWAIETMQCRWIVADEAAGADALMCGAVVEPHRPFCRVHSARAYIRLVPEEDVAGEGEEKTEDEDPKEEQEAE